MPTVLLYHYMDDLLVAAQHHEVMEKAVALVTDAVNSAGLSIAPEKVQKFPPWKYLGWWIRAQTIVPQPLQINTNVRNLHDAQKLLGTINWVRPLLGISNTDLGPLFDLLKGDTNLVLHVILTLKQIALYKRLPQLSFSTGPPMGP